MNHLTIAVALCSLVPLLACAPPTDEEGFSTDVNEAVATRGHDFGCFAGEDNYTLQLAIDGEGDDAENIAAVVQDGETNFETGTWSYDRGLGGETLSVEVGARAFTTDSLERKFGTLVSFPADGHDCRLRGFIPYGDDETLEGTFVCEDEFWDSVTLELDADFGLYAHSVRDDDGNVTEQEDYGAYFLEGGELFVLRPENDDPSLRFARGSAAADALDLYGVSCARQ
jgi:hypothetical protein